MMPGNILSVNHSMALVAPLGLPFLHPTSKMLSCVRLTSMLRFSNILLTKLTLEMSMDLPMLEMLKMCWKVSSHSVTASNVLMASSFNTFVIRILLMRQTKCTRRFVPQPDLETHCRQIGSGKYGIGWTRWATFLRPALLPRIRAQRGSRAP